MVEGAGTLAPFVSAQPKSEEGKNSLDTRSRVSHFLTRRVSTLSSGVPPGLALDKSWQGSHKRAPRGAPSREATSALQWRAEQRPSSPRLPAPTCRGPRRRAYCLPRLLTSCTPGTRLWPRPPPAAASAAPWRGLSALGPAVRCGAERALLLLPGAAFPAFLPQARRAASGEAGLAVESGAALPSLPTGRLLLRRLLGLGCCWEAAVPRPARLPFSRQDRFAALEPNLFSAAAPPW